MEKMLTKSQQNRFMQSALPLPKKQKLQT